jgi:AcrR family transcriptional regulator
MPLRPAKRQAIIEAARAVFGRLGYVRAGTDAIAAEANVSTRTLYNHFPTKQDLFTTVLVEGATAVADAFVVRMAALPPDRDAESTVLGIARALAAHRLDFPQHFATARHADVESEHLATDTIDARHAAGPERVRAAVAARLAQLSARGLVDLADPGQAADQLILLVAGAVAFQQNPGADDVAGIVAAGVHTFLYGHLPRAS